MSNEIVIAHLCTGQTLVSKLETRAVEGHEEGQMVLIDPLVIFAVPSQNGRLQVSLQPFGSLFGALPPIKELPLWGHALVCPLVAAPLEVSNEYIKMMSGIAIAPAGGHLSLVTPK